MLNFGFLVADTLLYLLIMIGFLLGMFFARESDAISEYLGLVITISLFSVPIAGGITLGMLYYWSAHRIDNIDLPGPRGYEKRERDEMLKEALDDN